MRSRMCKVHFDACGGCPGSVQPPVCATPFFFPEAPLFDFVLILLIAIATGAAVRARHDERGDRIEAAILLDVMGPRP